jgi:glycosyltransferase involved in cell wall biosynthesis
MRICIDTRSPGLRGVLPYTQCLLGSLLRIDRDNEYIVITDREHRNWGHKGVDEIVVPSNNPVQWIAWSNTTLPKLFNRKKVDVYHSLKHMTLYRSKVKNVLTMHAGGMVYEFPEFYKWYDLMYWKFSYPMAIRRYDRVITVSHDEKQYFTDKLGYPEDRFRVTQLAADERFRAIEDSTRLQSVREKYHLPDHFVLFVGWIHPQKNLEGLVRGFSKAKGRLPGDHKLVIVGGEVGTYSQQIRRLIEELGLGSDVIFTGYITEELPCVYNLADLLVFPTRFEAFPAVPLEAMACGVPVVASNIGAVHEVVGDAAVLVNPDSDDDIAESVVHVLNSGQVRQSLIQKGLERGQVFSWDQCAKETLKVYEELASA